MSESSYNIERATNGLVLALFLVSALFLGVMLYYVLQDIDTRQSEEANETAVVVDRPSPDRPGLPVNGLNRVAA
jgi:formate-dependent nitrite reductase membrane component NrfD